jgi:hypothetical protein
MPGALSRPRCVRGEGITRSSRPSGPSRTHSPAPCPGTTPSRALMLTWCVTTTSGPAPRQARSSASAWRVCCASRSGAWKKDPKAGSSRWRPWKSQFGGLAAAAPGGGPDGPHGEGGELAADASGLLAPLGAQIALGGAIVQPEPGRIAATGGHRVTQQQDRCRRLSARRRRSQRASEQGAAAHLSPMPSAPARRLPQRPPARRPHAAGCAPGPSPAAPAAAARAIRLRRR